MLSYWITLRTMFQNRLETGSLWITAFKAIHWMALSSFIAFTGPLHYSGMRLWEVHSCFLWFFVLFLSGLSKMSFRCLSNFVPMFFCVLYGINQKHSAAFGGAPMERPPKAAPPPRGGVCIWFLKNFFF